MLNCSFGFARAFAAIAARLETGSYPSPALRPVGLPASECGSDFLIRHFRLSATPFAPRSLPASPLIWRGLTSRRSYSAACAALLSTSCDQTHGISQVHEQALANMPEPAPPVAEDRLASTPVSLPPSPPYPTGRRPQLKTFRGGCPFISPIRPVHSNSTRFDAPVTLRARVRSSPLSARL